MAAQEVRAKPHVEASPPKKTAKPAPHLHIPDILRVAFVARKDREGNDIVERLIAELAPHKNHLIALWGAGGVGKTAIAAEATRPLIDVYNQRVVWVSAEGLEDFSLATLLDGIATQLGNDHLRKLVIEPKKERVRETLIAAPTLVMLDNFETIAPEEGRRCAEWLAQPALCSALITTRENIRAAHRNIPTDPMLPEEAHDLLLRSIAEAHDQNAYANLDQGRVIKASEANPLVLQWIIRQIDLAQDAEEVLHDLKHGEGTAAERVFDRSFDLKQLDNGGRAVLLALSLFLPSATRKALAEVAGLGKDKDRKRFRDAVKTLSSLWLLRTAEGGERLAVEGLTRELTKARLSYDPRSITIRARYVERFRRYAKANSRPAIEDLNSIGNEKDNILNALDIAVAAGKWNDVMEIAYALMSFLDLRGYWDEAIRIDERGLRAAREAKDTYRIGLFTNSLGAWASQRGDYAQARKHYESAVETARRFNAPQGLAATLHNLATAARLQGDLDHARKLYNESRQLLGKHSSENQVASFLHQLGEVSLAERDFETAESLFDQSLTILRKSGHTQYLAECLESIGNLRVAQGRTTEAITVFEESSEMAILLADRFRIGSVKRSQGLLAEKDNKTVEAAQLIRESLRIFEELGSPRAEDSRRDLKRLEGEPSE